MRRLHCGPSKTEGFISDLTEREQCHEVNLTLFLTAKRYTVVGKTEGNKDQTQEEVLPGRRNLWMAG